MPRTKKGTPPSYCPHASGPALVTVRTTSGNRRDILLGPWDTDESKAEYARVLGVLSAHGGRYPEATSQPINPSVNEVILAFWKHAESHYGEGNFRLLGDWSDAEATEWRLINHLPGTLDFGAVAEHLRKAGRKSHRFKTPELQGLLWRAESEADAMRLEAMLTSPKELCPTLASERYGSLKRPKSDNPPPSDDWGTVGDDRRTAWDDPKPGGIPQVSRRAKHTTMKTGI